MLTWGRCVAGVEYRCMQRARGMNGVRDGGDQSMKGLLSPAGRPWPAAFVLGSVRNGEPLSGF